MRMTKEFADRCRLVRDMLDALKVDGVHFDLREWRAGHGLSMRKAAALIGCSKAGLQNWEAKPETMPRYIWLACIALALAKIKEVENG